MLALLAASRASLFDPHPFPPKGPFFEGWYTRIIDGDDSFGIIFGRVLPQLLGTPLASSYLSILRAGKHGGSMDAADCTASSARVTIDGKPASTRPNFLSPPSFTWNASGSGSGSGIYTVTPESTVIDVQCGRVSFSAEIGSAVPWARGGRGPAHELDRLPLPLHWFVYSTYELPLCALSSP